MRLLLISLVVACCSLAAQTPGPDLEALAARVTHYPTKFQLVRAGAAAVPVLMAQLEAGDAAQQFETRSALRWIAGYAGEQPGGTDAVVRALGPWLGKDRPAPARVFAAELLGEIGADAAVEPLALLLDEPAVRMSALAALGRIPGTASHRVLTRKLASVDPGLRPELMRTLVQRRESATLEILRTLALDRDTRALALECIGLLGDSRALDAVSVAAASDFDHAVAFHALLRIGTARGRSADGVLAFSRAYEAARTDQERVQALQGLASATLGDGLQTVERALAAATPETQSHAWRALAAVADGRAARDPAGTAAVVQRLLESCSDVPALVRALAVAGRLRHDPLVPAVQKLLSHERRQVQAAAVMALRDQKSALALAALRGALEGPARASVLEALAVCRDRESVPAMVALAQKGDAAAVRALGRIGDPRAAEALLPVAAAGDAVALDGCLQIAAQADAAQARAIYHRLLESRPEPRVLQALERVASGDSVPVLDKVLLAAEGERRVAALRCLTTAGDRLQSQGDRAAALSAFTRAQELGATGLEDRLRALGQRIEVVAREGRIDAWWLIGPFAAPDQGAWTRAEFPEQGVDLAAKGKAGVRELRWQPFTTTAPNAVVDLDPLFTPNDHVSAYAFCEVVAKTARTVQLKCGSDDGIVVWLNGRKVHEFLGPRGLKVDQDTVAVPLQEGANALLVKVIDIAGGWSFHVRLVEEGGEPARFRIR